MEKSVHMDFFCAMKPDWEFAYGIRGERLPGEGESGEVGWDGDEEGQRVRIDDAFPHVK
jgi:hypothetical protein